MTPINHSLFVQKKQKKNFTEKNFKLYILYWGPSRGNKSIILPFFLGHNQANFFVGAPTSLKTN